MVDKERRVLREAAVAEAGEERALKPAGTQPGMLLADIGVFTGFTTANVEAELRASPGGSAVKRVEVKIYCVTFENCCSRLKGRVPFL